MTAGDRQGSPALQIERDPRPVQRPTHLLINRDAVGSFHSQSGSTGQLFEGGGRCSPTFQLNLRLSP